MRKVAAFGFASFVALLGAVACGVHSTDAPSLTGPSGLALSIGVSANPDTIALDGGSQSSIQILARDATGKPMMQTFSVSTQVNNSPTDYGTLSAHTVVTGSDGIANVVYTAPPPLPIGAAIPTCQFPGQSVALAGQCVSVVATATGQPGVTNFIASQSQSVVLRLVPPGIIVLPGSIPTSFFVFAPSTPAVGAPVQFDASTSCGGPTTGGTSTTAGVCPATSSAIVSYVWDFGDGGSATGRIASHPFLAAQTYSVTLTITNAQGVSEPKTITIPISAGTGTAPTAVFSVSPSAPGVGDTVFFNASSSAAGTGHTIASYAWTFGDGATGTGVAPTHAYTIAGSYGVQLVVTDEIGQSTTSASQSIAVGSPPSPTANFTFSPGAPGRNDQVVFDASSSSTSQGQTIVDVAWNFGDGTPVIHCPGDPSCVNVGVTNRVSAHTFATNQTFVVNLVVTDTAGRTGSHNTSVSVALADPNVLITTSPGSPNPGTTVFFNSNNTTYYPGSVGPITFAWTFGDGTGSVLANPTKPGGYPAVGTYTVGLSVTDGKGRTGVNTATVTVVAVTPPTPPASPVAAFTSSPPTPSFAAPPVFFDASGSTTPSGAAIITYRWNFGDGTIISGPTAGVPPGGGTYQSPHHAYAAQGAYTVTLTVTDTNNLSGSTTGTVTVGP